MHLNVPGLRRRASALPFFVREARRLRLADWMGGFLIHVFLLWIPNFASDRADLKSQSGSSRRRIVPLTAFPPSCLRLPDFPPSNHHAGY